MKKRLISLSLISVASVLAITGCANIAFNQPAVVQQEFDGDHRALPVYAEDELPEEDEVYDLTKELTYEDIEPATAEQFDQFVTDVVGPTLFATVKDAFPNLYGYVVKHNAFTQSELYNLSGIAKEIAGYTQGHEFDPEELIVRIATYVDLDKIYYLLHQMKEDDKAFKEVKKFVIAMSNSTFVQNDYRAAYADTKALDLKDLANWEEYTWDDFYACSDDYEVFCTISDFFSNPDVRVFLRFVNLLAKSLVKNLTKHELGFAFTMMGLIEDEDYADLCYRYMMNNASSFVKHLGNIIKGINITDDSWMQMLRGAQTVAYTTRGDDDFVDGDNYCAIDHLAEKAFLDQVDAIYDAIDPHGIKVLLKFIGNVLNALPKDLMNNAMVNYEDPSQVDAQAFVNVYLEQYGLLPSGEKQALDDQCEILGIDLDEFNTEVEGENPVDYLMELLNANLVGPFMEFFTQKLEPTPIYPEYEDMGNLELRSGREKLILRQGDEFTAADLVNFLNEPNALRVNFWLTNHYVDRYYFEDKEYRSIYVVEGDFDTSKPGRGYVILKYHVDLECQMYKAPEYTEIETRTFAYDFEWKLFYYVVHKSVQEYCPGFETELYERRFGYYDKDTDVAVDSNGNIALRDYKGVINLVKDTQYAPDQITLQSSTHGFFKYDAAKKRFVDLDRSDDLSFENVFYQVSNLDTSKLGLHYGYYPVQVKKNGEVVATVQYVFCYNVVESIDYKVEDGFYDPGFGW